MSSILTKYRTSDIHDVMEIQRNKECEFDPEPTTIPSVYSLFIVSFYSYL